MSTPFVNIHCHNGKVGQAVIIQNIFVQNRSELIPQTFYSLGLHPWYSNQPDLDVKSLLIKYIESDLLMVAVGEIGIDRSIKIPIDIQIRVFETQLTIAQTYNLPVIIHSVKAYSDIIHSITKCKITIPIIIHGYYGNNEITSKLLSSGFYFSFGKQLMLKNKNALSALKRIPLERMFFETDDEHYLIQSIYRFAALELNLSVKYLKEKICNNYSSIFNNEIVKK